MSFVSSLRSVCLVGLVVALPSVAWAADDPQPVDAGSGHPAAVPLLGAGAISGFLGCVALYIGLHQNDQRPINYSEDPFRTGFITAGGMALGLGVVLVSAGIPAALAMPPTSQRASVLEAASAPKGLIVGCSVEF